MGSNLTQTQERKAHQRLIENQKQKSDKEYIKISQIISNIVGKPRIVKSNITNIQLEQYYVTNQQSNLDTDIQIYKLRSSSYSKNIVVVFYHKVIDQDEKLFLVRVEKMKGRLNQIDSITFLQGLALLEAALNGFSQLVYHAKAPFVVTQKMIGVNQNCQVRVWLNENYALNKVMAGIKIRSQNIMINQIFSAVADRIQQQQARAFQDIRYKIGHCHKIVEAKSIIVGLLQNRNRKLILQDLVQKQIERINKMNKNIKIPMNCQLPCQINHSTNAPVPNQLKKASMDKERFVQKISLNAEECIKNDENSDRNKMTRHEINFINNDLLKNKIQNGVGPSGKTWERLGLRSNEGLDKKGQSPEQRNIVLSDRSQIRTTKIFGTSNRKSEEDSESNLTSSPIHKNRSTFEIKHGDIGLNWPNLIYLNNKLVISENKQSRMEKKINKLKHDLMKTQQKPEFPYAGTVRNDNYERTFSTNKKQIAECEVRPVTKYEKIIRFKSENADSGMTHKVDRKLSDNIVVRTIESRGGINKTVDQKNLDKITQNKVERNSETLYEENKNLGKSMISDRKSTIDYLGSTPSNNNRPIIFQEKNLEKWNIYQNKIGFLKSPSQMQGQKLQQHTQYVGQTNQSQMESKKIQINFNGNQFVSSGKPYLHGDLTENKSSVMNRKSHF